MNQQYIGNIYNIFLDVLSKKDGFSVGEKLTAVEKLLNKKRNFYSTDKEIYEAMEKYVKQDEDIDEPFETEEAFVGFVEVMTNNTDKVLTFGVGKFYNK